jgi:hypothetical protein
MNRKKWCVIQHFYYISAGKSSSLIFYDAITIAHNWKLWTGKKSKLLTQLCIIAHSSNRMTFTTISRYNRAESIDNRRKVNFVSGSNCRINLHEPNTRHNAVSFSYVFVSYHIRIYFVKEYHCRVFANHQLFVLNI